MTARDTVPPPTWITSLSTADLEALTAEYMEASDRLYLRGREDGYEDGKADAGGFTLGAGLLWFVAGGLMTEFLHTIATGRWLW